MKSISLLTAALVLGLGSGLRAQTSFLDLSFDLDGKTTTALTAGSDYGFASVLQPDGKIVVAGTASNTFSLARYNADGSLDTGFGINGTVSTTIGQAEGAAALARQPDGKLIAAGYTLNAGDLDFAMVRYNADGSLDTSFGTGGKVTTPFSTGQDLAGAIELQPDGKIILGGRSVVNSIRNFAVMRYHADGTLDASFGTGGKASPTFGTNDQNQINDMALQPDGKIVVAGDVGNFNPGLAFFGMARLNADGSLDTGFGTGGTVTLASGGSGNSDTGKAMLLQPDGKIVIAGEAAYGDHEFMLLRFHANGTPDTGFGTAGQTHTHIGIENARAASVILLPDGRLVAGGHSFDNFGVLDFTLAAYLPNGSLDTSWGNAGIITTNLSGSDEIKALLLQPDSKIVAIGSSDIGPTADFAVARYEVSGTVGLPENAVSVTDLAVYPNPAADQAVLNYTLPENGTLTISLIDAQGRTAHTYLSNCQQQAGAHQEVVQLPAGLAAGLYTFLFTSESSQTCLPIVVK
jgi:uncharacterized delta-60 repeat protein